MRRLHLVLPGLFNESWLYWDGNLLAHRPQKSLWWLNSYDFCWDVDLGDGRHWIALRNRVGLRMAGIFRRPFFYAR